NRFEFLRTNDRDDVFHLSSPAGRPLSPFTRNDLVILALTDAAQRIIFPQGIAAKAVPRENSAKIRMTDKDDPEHVVSFALQPLGSGPDAADAVHFQTRIALLVELLITRRAAG